MELNCIYKNIPYKKRNYHLQARRLSGKRIKYPTSSQGFIYVSFISFMTIVVSLLLFASSIVSVQNQKNKLKTQCFRVLESVSSTINLTAEELIISNFKALIIQGKKIVLYAQMAAASTIPYPANIAAVMQLKMKHAKLSLEESYHKTLQDGLENGARKYILSAEKVIQNKIQHSGGESVVVSPMSLNLSSKTLYPTRLKYFSRTYGANIFGPRISVIWDQRNTDFILGFFSSYKFGTLLKDQCSVYLSQKEGVWKTSLSMDKY